jgi:hypothetical protein
VSDRHGSRVRLSGPRLGPRSLLGFGHDLLHPPGRGRGHEQRRHVGVALGPGARVHPPQIQRELPGQAGDRHRAPVNLHHGVVLGLALPDHDERIGHNRGPAVTERELLPGLHLAGKRQQLPPEGGSQPHQRHVQPGDRRGVAQELLLGLLPLPSPGELPAPVKGVGKAGGPPVIRRRALVGIWLAPPAHPKPPQAVQPVPGRPLWEFQQRGDLLGRGHAMLAQHGHDLPIGRRQLIQRRSPGDGTHLPCLFTIFGPRRMGEGLRGRSKQS